MTNRRIYDLSDKVDAISEVHLKHNTLYGLVLKYISNERKWKEQQ